MVGVVRAAVAIVLMGLKNDMKSFNIRPVNRLMDNQIQEIIDNKTKPLGSLGRLETKAKRIALILNNSQPVLEHPVIFVFAGDHGIAAEGVSAYPSAVTRQMVENFRRGGAAINVFCRQHRIKLHVVDAGVDFDFEDKTGIIDAKVNRGTRNFLHGPAMTHEEFQQALQKGAEVVNLHAQGSNIIGFGEMGIGNTSASSVLMSLICKLPLEECIGKGTGLSNAQLMHKFLVLQRALERYKANVPDWMDLNQAIPYFAGFEMVMMAGAMLQTASLGKVIMVDGFIATAVFACAYVMNPLVREYAVFTHLSEEQGHAKLIEFLQSEPLLNLKLRLGEGTGCALAYPILESACLFLREMASFESAGVSQSS